MRTSPWTSLRFLALLAAALTTLQAQQPTPLLTRTAEQLVAVLQSNANQQEKAEACRELAVNGGKAAVPALAALLPDEKLNHMARYALETIADPSVDQALRQALGTTHGRPLVGVIGSIGVRRDAEAVAALEKLLADADVDVAQAAARSLGSIASPTAVEALQRAVNTAPPTNQWAFCEGLLRCAERIAPSNPKRAAGIYDQLRHLPTSAQVRVAAVRGGILVGGKAGVTQLREDLKSADYIVFAAAVRTSYELAGEDATKALALELPQLRDDDHRILVLRALGKRPDKTALSALSSVAKQAPQALRIVAIQSLGETGQASAAPTLADLMIDANREISQAALESFAGLQGKQADALVESLLKSKQTARRLVGIELVGRRRLTALVPELLKVAASDADSQTRPLALSKVGELGGAKEAGAVLDLLPKLSASADLDAAEQALSALCAKASSPQACSEKLTSSLPHAHPGQKIVLLRVLASVGGPSALQAVTAAVNDSNAEVHAAAVRALADWKTAEAAPELLVLAKAGNPMDRTLCVRSYLGMASNPDVPAPQRLAMCREANGMINGSDEKKLLLAALGTLDSQDALALILPCLGDPATKEEASVAVVAVAEKMLKNNNPGAAYLAQPLEKVGQTTTNEELAKRVKALLQQLQKKAAK